MPIFSRRLTACLLTLALLVPVRAAAADLGAAADAIDNYGLPAYPIIYGEIVDKFPEEEMKNINAVLKGVEIFGYCKALGDIANKIDSGDNLGASLDLAANGVNIAVTLLKDDVTKKVMLGSVGVAALPLTALLTTIDIARKSSEAVQTSKTALDLERLYYLIETDPTLKVKGRELGQGDPIRVDATAVEYMWRKVLSDEKWAELMKNYVTSEMNQEWPEPSLWDRITVSSDYLREDALLQEKTRLKAHIAGLLRIMNTVAKKREQGVLVSQMLKGISATTSKISAEQLSNAFVMYAYALKELPAVKLFVDGLPAQVTAFQARVAKASAVELVKIKETDLIKMLAAISQSAATVQKLPSTGRHAAVRKDLLTRLDAGYKGIAGVHSSVLRSEINNRLAEEAKLLAKGETEFKFSRYECGTSFEELKGDFAQQVQAGSPEAGSAVGRVRTKVQELINTITPKYQEDLDANSKLYGEKRLEITTPLGRLREQRAKAANDGEKANLDAAIAVLSDKLNALDNRYSAYNQLQLSTKTVDIEGCTGILTEIDTFVQGNSSRYQTVRDSLGGLVGDAGRKMVQYQEQHRQTTNGLGVFLAEELEELDKIMRDNPDAYAGVSFAGLKTKLVNKPEASTSTNLRDTLRGINEQLMKQADGIYAGRMFYYNAYDVYYRKNLHYMESPVAKADLKVVTDAIAVADAAINATPDEDIQTGAREWLAELKQTLVQLRTETDRLERALTRVGGMAQKFDAYCNAAVRVNSQIREDSNALFAVIRRFSRAFGTIDMLVAEFLMTDVKDRVLDGGAIIKALEDHEILSFSLKAEIGIETIAKETFYEIKGPKGLVTITAQHFATANTYAAGLPTTDYQQFYDRLQPLREQKGEVGLLFTTYFEQGAKFVTMFKVDSKLGAEAKRLYDTIVAKRDLAMANQTAIDERKARFDLILEKASGLHQEMNGAFGRKSFDMVVGYGSYVGTITDEYRALGATRADIDQVFAAITQIVSESKRLQSEGAIGQSAKVTEFYGQFKEAYQARNDSVVVSMIADEWQAGDGTTLSDLQANLSRSFRLFDDIKYELANMRIVKTGENYNVSYDVTITSRIYSRNIKHVEKSQVNELVSINAQGKAKIIKTLNGRFWYVE